VESSVRNTGFVHKQLQVKESMSEILKKAMAKLPEIFSRNASGIMLRTLAGMQQQLDRDIHAANASYLTLLLKMSHGDITIEFAQAFKASLEKAGTGEETASGGLSLSLDMPADPLVSVPMSESELAFRKLEERGRSIGVRNLQPFSNEAIVDCAKAAMGSARISQADVQALTPFLRRALNIELVSAYEKLSAL
jgi:hypothetical protein